MKQNTTASRSGNAHNKNFPAKKSISLLRRKITGGDKTGTLVEEERRFLLNEKSGFFGREAYNMLRTNLSFALAEQENCKVVMITSPLQSEGKSITAANLAITLAEAGNRVLLIDCDLRRPKLGRLLSLKAQAGLSDILINPSQLKENIIEYRKGVRVILAGSIPPNPSELLSSARMEALLTNLREYYNYIILDTPPIDVVTDAAVLASHTDGVLLIVRTGRSERGPVMQAVEQLEYANARILGFVMTCVPMENTSYAYGRHRYKRYGYKRYRRYGYGKYGYGYGGYGGYGYGYGYGYGGYGYGANSRVEDREKWRGAIRDEERDPDD